MNHHEHRRDVGPAELFSAAREAIFTWKLQELAGVVIRPARRVAEGLVVDLWLNPAWPAPPRRLRGRDLLVTVGSCVVIKVIDDADRASFTYRTLPGHLENGEETFLVSKDAEGSLIASVTADSTPGHPLLKAAGPISTASQTMMAKRYTSGLKKLLAGPGHAAARSHR